MKQHKLKLNEDKTEFMVFGTRHQFKNLKINSFQSDSDTVLKSPSVRNLGMIMDQYLKMSSHVASVCKVCYCRLRSIWKISQFLTKEATKSLVYGMVIFKFDYCNSLLYGINQYLIAKLQKVQNAAARLIMHCHQTAHTSCVYLQI